MSFARQRYARTIGNLGLVEAKTALEDVVALGDELHVSVLQ